MAPFQIWNAAGYVLEAGKVKISNYHLMNRKLFYSDTATSSFSVGTTLLGEKAAMICTVAFKSCIVEHYNNQIRQLMSQNIQDSEREILESIQKCRDDEQDHHDLGLTHGAESAPAYQLLTNVIKTECKTAIWLSERI